MFGKPHPILHSVHKLDGPASISHIVVPEVLIDSVYQATGTPNSDEKEARIDLLQNGLTNN
jgi:hypothetical protein